MQKILIDTSVYIDFLRTGRFANQVAALYTFRAPSIYFSSVVAEELLQGVLDSKGKKLVEKLYYPFEKADRLVTPIHGDWEQTGNVLAQIRKSRKDLKLKIPGLMNDILLAMSVRRIRGVIFTANKRDFELIAGFKSFQFRGIPSD